MSVGTHKGMGVCQMTMFAAQFKSNSSESLHIEEVSIPKINKDEVLIQVYATAVNRADILQRQGKYPPPTGKSLILGLEASGIVHKIGSNVSKWKVGDKVMALCNGGGYAEYVAVHENHVLSLPSNLNYVEAAAIPEVWLTAFQLLHTLGELKSKERVLIHAGGSGVGTAAVQIAKLSKAVVVVTAGSEQKLKNSKILGAKHAISYKTNDFEEEVKLLTNGVDLVLDCVGGSYWKKNVACLAVDGRWILYGLLGGPEVNGDFFKKLLAKRIKLIATTLRSRSDEYKSELVEDFSKKILPHIINGDVKPIVDSTFSLSELSAAHDRMEGNQNIGKIVIIVKEEDPKEGGKAGLSY